MKKEFIFWTIAILMLAIICTSAQGYTIDGDTVYIQRQHADITAYPHTISNPWEWQNFKLDVKTSGDMCVAYKTPERIQGSQIQQLTQTGYKDRKSYFNTLQHQGSYYYYTEDSFSVTAGNEYEWRIRYGHKNSDWKTNIILWNSVSGDCRQDYIDGPQVLYDLDPWAVSTDFKSCKNISIKGADSAIGWFPLFVELSDTTDMTRNDIRIVDAECNSAGDLLDHEVELFDVNDAGIWIGKNISDTDDFTISLYFNNSVLDTGIENSSSVWRNYISVWHLSDLTNENGINDATNNGASSTTGTTGDAYDFESTQSDFMSVGDDNIFSFTDGGQDQPFTFEAWIRPESTHDGLITSKFGTATSSREWAFWGMRSNNRLLFSLDEGNGDYILIESPLSSITALNWYRVVFTYTGNEALSGMDFYIDGSKVVDSGSSSGTYDGMQNTATPLYIGRRDLSSAFYFDGIIDDLRISDTNFTADYIAYDYEITSNDNSYVTVYPEIFNPVFGNTSMQLLDVSPENDFFFASSSFSLASSISFNVTNAREATFTGSMNIVKLNNPPSQSDVSIRIDLDGTPIHQEVLRTVTGNNNFGSTGITPFIDIIGSGEHVLDIYYSATGGPQINVSNQKISALIGQSADNNEIDISVIDANFTISSSSVSPVFTWNITKDIDDTDTFIFTKQSTDSTGNSISLMYFNDTEDTEYSPYWSRYTASTATGALLGLWIDTDESGTHEHDIMGSVSTGSTDITSTVLDFDLADSQGKIIQSSRDSNSSSDLDNDFTLTTGTHQLLNISHIINDGTGMLVSAQVTADTNNNGNTPTFTISTDTGEQYTMKRTFSTVNQPGNVIMFTPFNGTQGTMINVSLSVTVPAAKSLEILDEEMTIFDIDFVEGELGNIPPIFISQPINDTLYVNMTLNDTYQSNGTFFDLNNDDVNITTNCTFLTVTVNNVTDSYDVSGTVTYSDIGTQYCILNMTDISDGSSLSDTFTIDILNITYEQLTVSTPPDFVLNVNATLNDSIAYEGTWFSGQNRSADVSSDCSYLDIITFNTSKTYWLNWTAVYPGDIMADSCQLSIQSSLLSNTSSTFTIDVNNATYTPGVDPGPEPEVNVTGRLEYIGCTSDTTPDAILLIGILFLVGIISISFYWINRSVQLPIMSGFSIMYGGLLCFIAWNFATCFFLSVWMIVLLGIGNIIDGFVTMVSA